MGSGTREAVYSELLQPRRAFQVFTVTVSEGTIGTVDTTKAAVTYSRVSTEGQVDGFSLDAQKRETRKAAEKLGCKVLKEFVDEGVSGTLEDRPAFTELLRFCAENKGRVGYVIVKDIDRFSRETLVHQILRRKLQVLGINLFSINQPSISENNPQARFMENIFSSVAQLERDQIVQRCLSGTKEAVLRGAWTCRAPYGYDYTKTVDGMPTLKIIPERAEAVRKAFQMYSEGALLTAIAEKLHAMGYLTSGSRKFSKQSIDNMLKNPAYIGKVKHRQFPDRLIDGLHPAIVSQEVWDVVQRRFENRLPFPTKHKINPDFILTNILRCPECNGPMTGASHRGKSGAKFPYYRCRVSGCKAKFLKRDRVHEQFREVLAHLRPTEEMIQLMEESVVAVWREKWQDSCHEKARLSRQITELEQKRDAVVDKFITGKLPEDLYQRHLAKVDDEIVKVSQQREEHVLSEQQIRELLEYSRRFITSPLNTWEREPLDRKRLLQRFVFPTGLRPEKDGTILNLELSPLLKLIDGSVSSESNMVELWGTIWNSDSS